MNHKKIISIALLVLISQVAGAQPVSLYKGMMESLTPNQDVDIVELTLRPGSVGHEHRHDAYVYVYVVEGTLDMQVEGGELTRLSAGEVFVETPKDVHTVMNNPSDTEQTRFIAVLVKNAE